MTSPVASGPGQQSRRVDLGPAASQSTQPIRELSGGTYGDVKQNRELQQAAPLPEEASGPAAREPVPLDAESGRPDEPITAGIDLGEGPGSEVLQQTAGSPGASYGPLMDLLSGISAADSTGTIASLMSELERRGIQ